MNLRKLFYLPNTEQKKTLLYEIKEIEKVCDDTASEEFIDQKENQKTHDERCDKCHNKDGIIVDKIRNVEGNGNVKGSVLSLVINGSITIKTGTVNHCNECGHEWHKFKIKYFSKTDIIGVTLKYLAEIIDNPDEVKRYKWKKDYIKIFDKCHAETIHQLTKSYDKYINSQRKKILSLSNLRKHYPSVFN